MATLDSDDIDAIVAALQTEGVRLADGVAHGGSAATLELGSSSGPGLKIQSSTTDAAQLIGGSNGAGLKLQGGQETNNAGPGLYCVGGDGNYDTAPGALFEGGHGTSTYDSAGIEAIGGRGGAGLKLQGGNDYQYTCGPGLHCVGGDVQYDTAPGALFEAGSGSSTYDSNGIEAVGARGGAGLYLVGGQDYQYSCGPGLYCRGGDVQYDTAPGAFFEGGSGYSTYDSNGIEALGHRAGAGIRLQGGHDYQYSAGPGFYCVGGDVQYATAPGALFEGGSGYSSYDSNGLEAHGHRAGAGMKLLGGQDYQYSTGPGLLCAGGSANYSASPGLQAQGGINGSGTHGSGLQANSGTGGSANGVGIEANGNSSGAGILAFGGQDGGAGLEARGGGNSGHGLWGRSMSNNYDGIRGDGFGSGAGIKGMGGNAGIGMEALGGSGSNQPGFQMKGDGSGHGLVADPDIVPTPAAAGDAMTLTGDYDAAKTAAQAGDEMSLAAEAVNAAALAGDGLAAFAAAILDLVDGIESGKTPRQALRLILAAAAGKSNGLDGTTAHYRDTNDTKNRITATVDEYGNRSAMTLDAS